MDVAVLVLSCDKYSWLWEGWYRQWAHHWKVRAVSVFFATETKPLPDHWENITPIYVGAGHTWSTCLLRALAKVPHETIFFSLEDYWPTQDMHQGLWDALYGEFKDKGVLCLRCSHEAPYYKLQRDGVFKQDSGYLVSCQTSFWDRLFLASCAEKDESPWEFEINGTKRIRDHGLAHLVAFHYLPWYTHVCVRGKLIKEGKWLENQRMRDVSSSRKC